MYVVANGFIGATVRHVLSSGCYRTILLNREGNHQQALGWMAGQFVQVAIPESSLPESLIKVKRPFSYASDPRNELIELHLVLVPKGKMSTAIECLQPDDSLLISRQAYGFLTIEEIQA